MTEKMVKMEREIGEHRDEIVDKMVQFLLTDMMLFWGQEKDLIASQEKVWRPLLEWAQQALDAKLVTTNDLDVPKENLQSGYRLKLFLQDLSDKELVAFYVAALDMRSVLLAAALVKGRLSADEAFEAAFLEELWQAKNWGADDEAENRRAELKQELIEIEEFLKS